MALLIISLEEAFEDHICAHLPHVLLINVFHYLVAVRLHNTDVVHST